MPTFSLGITGEKWWGDLCGLGSLSLFCVTQHLSMPLSKYSAAPLEMLKATGITKLNQIKCVQQVFPPLMGWLLNSDRPRFCTSGASIPRCSMEWEEGVFVLWSPVGGRNRRGF